LKKIGVVSGKGGVGKTTVAVSLSLGLARRGYRVGLVDLDLTGSNIPDVFGRRELGVSDNDMLIPSEHENIKYVSLGQIVGDGDPVLWDPKDVRSAARQLFERTVWGDLDYIVFDFPPGFEAETLEMLPLMDYVLIVTVPSALSRSKVERMIEATREYGVPIIGVVENMAYMRCPSCGAPVRVFTEDHSFEEYGIPIIARIPLDPMIASKKVIEDFPVDKVLEAMNRPIILQKRPGVKRMLLELLLRVIA
jgi:ATP-binding protein involved in chromosome partitioning